jgi:hypothetical protein
MRKKVNDYDHGYVNVTTIFNIIYLWSVLKVVEAGVSREHIWLYQLRLNLVTKRDIMHKLYT